MTNDFKVEFDIRMLHHSGIGAYIRGLLEGVSYLPDAPKFIFWGPHRYRCEVPERLCELYVVRDFPIYSWQEQILFPERLRFQTLFHAPHYNIPLRFRGKLVVSIHDLNHLEFSKNLPTPLHRLYARYMFGEAAARAACIIADSEFMKKEIIKKLKIAPERISVIPLAVSPFSNGSKKSQIAPIQNIPPRYLLAVGIHKSHKNYIFLIQTLAQLWKSGRLALPLVIAAPREKDNEEIKTIAHKIGVAEKIFLPGYVEKNQMPLLYQNAEALIFPSLYEGFGLPPLEAMHHGAPVLSSNRPPMTEVLSDVALFFNPESSDSLSDALLKLLSDSNLRAELIEKGRQNLMRFNWKKTAQATLDVYRKVLEGEPRF